MIDALALWWSSPVTAVLSSLLLLLLLGLVTLALVSVVRLGSITFGGLLAQRPRLLPGVPRRGDAFATLLLVLQIKAGLLIVLFSLASVRASTICSTSSWAALFAVVAGLAAVLALVIWATRGGRSEVVAAGALVLMRPLAPVLALLATAEPEAGDAEEKKGEEVDDREVQAFIGAGEEAGILEHEDAELIASIVDLGDTLARETMTPRTDIAAFHVDTDFDIMERRFAESMFTRIPVFRDTLDHIEGVVHVKDVLKATVAGRAPTAEGLMRPVLVVPETKPVRELLREFQASHQQMAVVVDEYGGTSGLVTLEDILEEIVGEIQDEHQREAPEFEEEAAGVYLIDGGAHVEVLDELFGVEVGETSFDSVAGLVLDRLGHLPRAGERASWGPLELEVVELDRRRVRRVRVQRVVQADAAQGEAKA